MGYIQHPSAPAAPPAAIMHVLSRFTRDDLAGFISVALDARRLTGCERSDNQDENRLLGCR